MKLHDKEKEKKKWLPGKIVENRFSHLCFSKSSTNFSGISWPLSPYSSLPNYKALKFYSPERKRWYPLLTCFLSWVRWVFLSLFCSHPKPLKYGEILEFSQSLACLKNFLTHTFVYQIKSFLFYYKYMWASFKLHG